MKKTFVFILTLVVLMSIAFCAAASPVVNEGLTLSIPDEYDDLLIVETSEEGMIFSVSEKASVEAAQAAGEDWEGAGWLFGIGTVNEETLHELLCEDMSGMRVFAKDSAGAYYMLYHPTDVRMVRADYSDQAAWSDWTMLNEWAASVPETFIAENDGLVAESYGNSMVEIALFRVMYRDDVYYTVSTNEYGPQEPNGINAVEYLLPLTEDVDYEFVDISETPDGEYVVLNFPEDDCRFDFFLSEGFENYVRQVWNNGENEMLYKAVFADDSIKAAGVMNDFYHDIVLDNSLGYTPDDLIGTWAEKIAGRGMITISKGEENTYDIDIHWADSAFQYEAWHMTGEPVGFSAVLNYNNGQRVTVTFTSETESTEEVIYENGTGSFTLTSAYEIIWKDDVDHMGDDTVFVNAD